MKTCLLGYRVRAFVPGRGWAEDRFELRQVAIECAQMCVATPNSSGPIYASVEEVTRERLTPSMFYPNEDRWISPEEFRVIWPPAEVE